MTTNQIFFRVLVPRGTDSMAHVSKLVADFKPVITAKAEKLMDAFMADRVGAGTHDETRAYDYWVDRRMASSSQGIEDPEVDTAFTLHVVPLIESFGHEQLMLLGVAYCVHPAWLKEWLKVPTVEDYAYWGVEERPSRIRQAEWAERGRHWDTTIDPNMAISTQMMTIDLLGPYEPFPKGMRAKDEPADITA